MSTNLSYLSDRPLNLNDWAYGTIKKRILNDELKPGDQLRIEELSAEMGISRTPIREALLRLAKDNLVRVESRVGFFVTEITKEDLKDLLELRLLIECYAAEKAAEKMDGTQIEELMAYQKLSRVALAKKDYLGFNTQEMKIHNMLIESLGNRRIADTMANVDEGIYRERIQALFAENVVASIEEHQRIINAIAAHDPKAARQAMEEHIRQIAQRFYAMMDSRKNTV